MSKGNYASERENLAAAFRWAVRLDMHEGVANHFSVAVDDEGHFLINPNQRHFARISASSLLLLNAHDASVMSQPNAPDPTAWGLHGAIHRHCPHARCVLHAHTRFATVLSCLADSTLPPIDQNTASFYQRYVVDAGYSGLAFEAEGERCAALLDNPRIKTMIMGNHGVLVIGENVADAFNRLYYFERAAETYIRALQTGQPLRILSAVVAERVGAEVEDYPGQADLHFSELKQILDHDEPDYRH